MFRFAALAFTLLFPLFLFAQKPSVTWSVRLPAASVEQAGLFMDSLNKKGVHEVILDPAFISFFQKNPLELKIILRKAKMKKVVLDAGILDSPLTEKSEKDWSSMAQFAHDIGAKFLLVHARKRDAYPPGKKVLENWAQSLEAHFKTINRQGVQLLVENGLHTICQTEEELNWLVSSLKNKKIKFFLRPAHLVQAGQNPVLVLKSLKKKTAFLELQGLISPLPRYQGPKANNYQLTGIDEPGNWNIPTWMADCRAAGFKGTMVLEVPKATDSTLFFSGLTRQMEYLKSQFGYTF